VRQTAEIYFFDGPLRGTYKFVDLEELMRMGTYRVLTPIPNTEIRNGETAMSTVKCTISYYSVQPLRAHYGEHKFVLLEMPR
jgi:hypothetical protein